MGEERRVGEESDEREMREGAGVVCGAADEEKKMRGGRGVDGDRGDVVDDVGVEEAEELGLRGSSPVSTARR
ncbi:hypothetical protein Droror1_Dr00015060 [Drosera rotundifolia]